MRTIKRNIVSALIFSRDNKLFLGMKDPNKGGVYIDCWHIPGGGVEKNEDLLDALKREILEESGIDISWYDIELIDNKGKGASEKTLENGEKVLCEMNFNVYRIVLEDKNASEIKIHLNDDLIKYQWVNLDNLKDIKLTPPSLKLFQRLKLI